MADIYDDQGEYLNAKAALEALLENYKKDEDLISKARAKLKSIEEKIVESNRIKAEEDPALLELDTLGNG